MADSEPASLDLGTQQSTPKSTNTDHDPKVGTNLALSKTKSNTENIREEEDQCESFTGLTEHPYTATSDHIEDIRTHRTTSEHIRGNTPTGKSLNIGKPFPRKLTDRQCELAKLIGFENIEPTKAYVDLYPTDCSRGEHHRVSYLLAWPLFWDLVQEWRQRRARSMKNADLSQSDAEMVARAHAMAHNDELPAGERVKALQAYVQLRKGLPGKRGTSSAGGDIWDSILGEDEQALPASCGPEAKPLNAANSVSVKDKG